MSPLADFFARILLIVSISTLVIGFIHLIDPGIVNVPVSAGIIATSMACAGWIPLSRKEHARD